MPVKKKPESKSYRSGRKITPETTALVLDIKLKNPHLSIRDIGRKADVSYQSVANIIKGKFPDLITRSEQVQTLFETNIEIIQLASEKVKNSMKSMEPADIKETKVMQDIVDTAFRQNQLISGKATEIKKIDFSGTPEEINQAILLTLQ